MFIAKELIAKGLLATAATATAITLGVVYGDNIVKYMSSEDEGKLIGEVGLSCESLSTATATNGVVCSKKTGSENIKVKRGETNFEVSTIAGGSIKVYKLTGTDADTYKQGLKFVIVGGDIAGTTGADTTNKLEEFETYEINLGDNNAEESLRGKYYLSRKTDVNTEIKKALGLPDGCNLPTTSTEVECDIAGESFKKVNFEGKDGQTAGPTGAKLKISKVGGEPNTNFYGKYGLKFVLESATDVTIATGTAIKKNTNTEFKIKVTGAEGQGPRTVTLEKAWSVAELAKKIGVVADSCTAENADAQTTKECTLGTTISVFNGENSYVKEATITEGQKLTFATGEAGYNQGYKFTAGTAIALTAPSGTGSSAGSVENIEASTATASYEIKEQTVSGNKKWFLSKVTAVS